MGTQLVWFKRDLRVNDHRPLTEALRHGPTVAFYLFEPVYLTQPETTTSHLGFIRDCLIELSDELHRLRIPFIIRRSDIISALNQFKTEHPFSTLWSHEETGAAWSYERDRSVAQWCKSTGTAWREYSQFGIARPHPTRNGWAKRWGVQMNSTELPVPKPQRHDYGRDVEKVPELSDLGLSGEPKAEQQRGGATAAREMVHSFLRCRGEHYQSGMSSPVTAWEQCSRVSPHLAYGSLSMRWLNHRTVERKNYLKEERRRGRSIGPHWLKSLTSYEKRLRWHCHFMQKLEDQPTLEHENMARIYDGLRPEPPTNDLFDAYCAGLTGYPMVDACIRALKATGWLNFRMRAMLVSFSSYHLWLPWQPTALFLARHFLDFEPGIHYPQVQMQSGTTGINTLRIYSPQKQVIDNDPQGRFIRAWVPELANLPDEYLHRPETLPSQLGQSLGITIGKTYPEPIVDHQDASKSARRAIFRLRRSPEARKEAQAVFVKHGSRKRNKGRKKAKVPNNQLELLGPNSSI